MTRVPSRIFQVVWGFDQFGGLEHHLTELSLALARRGAEVLVFSEVPVSGTNAYVRRLRDAGIAVSGAGLAAGAANAVGQLPLAPVWSGAARVMAGLRSLGERLPTNARVTEPDVEAVLAQRLYHPVTQDLFARLDAAADAAPPDVVHVHGSRLGQWWVLQWATARGIPTVYTEHVTLDEWGGPRDAGSVDVMREHAGVIACVSERSRVSLHATLGDEVPVAVVRHVVEDAGPVRSPSSDGPLRLLCAARLNPYKGIDVLLHAVARARGAGADLKLTIAGDGPERQRLGELAFALGLKDIHFLGAVAPAWVSTLMRDDDVVVLPSRGEGLPVALVEAMACGRAVVATRSGGNAEVVRHGETGLLVDSERPDQLADALLQLSNDRPLVERLGNTARQAWQDGGWSADDVVAETVELYRAAARRRRRDPMAERAEDTASERVRSICLVTWSLHGEGAMIDHIRSLALQLASRNVSVTILASSVRAPSRRLVAELERAGVEVRVGTPLARGRAVARAAMDRVRWSLRHGRRGGIRKAAVNAGLNLLAMLAERVREGRPSVVHVHGWRLGLAAVGTWGRTVGIPVVYTEHAGPEAWLGAPPPNEADLEGARAAVVLTSAHAETAHLLGGVVQAPVHALSHGNDAVLALGAAPAHALQAPREQDEAVRLVAVVADAEERTRVEDALERISARTPALEALVIASPAAASRGTTETHLAGISRDALASADIVYLSPHAACAARIGGFVVACGVPLILGGAVAQLPLVHRASALVVKEDAATIADAIDELARDSMLSFALAVAARRRVPAVDGRTGIEQLLADEALATYADALEA
ncbi:MAG: glycosyltransferase [Gemmatimonadaceae bacterium]|nr:glycosyltransferase [Gemmatimonadaceae bacterium]